MTVPLLALHLLAVNVASAGPLVCMYYEWREGRGHLASGRAGRWLARWAIIALLVGLATGLLVGWLQWSPNLKAALQRLDRKVFYGQIEIGFSLALMLLHLAWWRGPDSRGRLGRQFVLLLAGTNLLYHFPTLFAVLAHVRTLNDSAEPITAPMFRQLLAEPVVLSYALHVTLACFAVAGALMIWRADRGDEEDRALAKPAARLALAATLLQLPVGFWLTLAYPKSQQRLLMGGNAVATACFALSLLLALSLLHHLSAVSIRNESAASRRWSVWLTVAVVVLMTTVLTCSRP